VHRDLLVAALVSVALTACNDATPQSSRSTAGGGSADAASRVPPPSALAASDLISGCDYGALVVKLVIKLTTVNKTCHADVTPASVCVSPGGIVRWKIDNGCGALKGSDSAAALEITAPTFKAPLTLDDPAKAPATNKVRKLDSCAQKIAQLPANQVPPVFCEVDANADNGFYKYSLRGMIDPLDPDVEVRPPR
jgi:hypothetical protein